MQIPFPETFEPTLSLCGGVGFNLSVDESSSPISYIASLNSFLVSSGSLSLAGTTQNITISSFLVDYAFITGDEVTIPVTFVGENEDNPHIPDLEV